MRPLSIAFLFAALICACGGDEKTQATPTTAASPTPSHAAEDYTAAMTPLINAYGQTLAVLVALVEHPAKSDEWKQSVSKNALELKTIGVKVRAVNAPACVSTDHMAFLQGVDSFDRGSDALVDGIKDFNTVKLTEALANLNAGHSIVDQSTERMRSTHCS